MGDGGWDKGVTAHPSLCNLCPTTPVPASLNISCICCDFLHMLMTD